MSKEKLVPRLRFEEFQDTWEKYKLGEIGYTISGVGFPNSEQGGNKGVMFLKVSDMNIPENTTEINKANNYVLDTQIKRNRWKVINDIPAIIFAKVGAALLLDRKRLVSEKFLIDNNMMAYILEEKLIPNFTNALFKTIYLPQYSQTGALPSMNDSIVENISIYIPKIREQQKIGSIFKKIDQMIELQLSKLNKIKDIKSAYLSEMFPKEGEKYPKKRFEGFTEAWNLITFSDIAEVERGLTYHPSNIVESGGVRVLRSSNIDDDTFVIKDDDVFVSKDAINISFAEKQDILITSANGSPRLVGKHAILNTLDTESVHGGFMLLAKTDKPYFLNASMSSDWYGKFINYHVSGGGGSIGNIKKSDLEKQLIYVPSEEEQEKIGHFFKNLDNQISIEEQKLSKLEKLKQAYLNDMFV